MARVKTLSAYKMEKRIYDREDNVYDKKIVTRQLITNILLMYMDECRKALAEGERIEISKVGTIIPEVKVHIENFNLPMCNKDGGNPPYTKLKIRRNNIYIFGHSLDITDKDILRDLILNDNVKTIIFYPDKEELGRKIANLVKVIGQDELIRRTGGSTRTISFELQKELIERKTVP